MHIMSPFISFYKLRRDMGKKKPFRVRKKKSKTTDEATGLIESTNEKVNVESADYENEITKLKGAADGSSVIQAPLVWRKIDTQSEGKLTSSDKNHYDDPRSANFDDLYNDNANNFGMMSGVLEVLDGDAYIAHSKKVKAVVEDETGDGIDSKALNEPKKKKRKKKSNHVQKLKEVQQLDPVSEETLATTTINWTQSTGVALHASLLQNLAARNFLYPTPIQSQALASSVHGCDVVGAAPTGSGKTISYLLPVMNHILTHSKDDTDDIEKTSYELTMQRKLTALILTPTRELALQVTDEARILSSSVRVCTIVGGLAHAKQIRQLKQHPDIVVATPGRLWEFMDNNSDIMPDFSHLKYLIVDEADRLFVHGKFKELENILENLNAKEVDEVADDGASSVSEEEDEFAVHDVEMVPQEILNGMEHSGDNSDDINRKVLTPKIRRQLFIYSATLTLDIDAFSMKGKNEKKKKRKSASAGGSKITGPIADILSKAGSQNKVKVIDLSRSDTPASVAGSKVSANTPSGLSLFQVLCTQRHKDSHLYGLLVCTKIGSAGPSLIFCNSIGCVKRVHALLLTLGLPAKMLHAQLIQKARMQAVESLSLSKSRAVVVCTDVAARGLDITSVATVIHYDVPRSVDTFVHRSGRTARGVGKQAVGNSVSLVSPAEERKHLSCCLAVGRKGFEDAGIDGKLLSSSQERVSLAAKIVSLEEFESRLNLDNSWYRNAAEEAGLDLDESLLDDGVSGRSKRELRRQGEARRSRETLRELLAQPMRKQNFGKFLSGAGLREAIRAESEVKPYVVEPSGNKKNRVKRKQN